MKFFARLRERLRAYEREHNFTCDVCGREVFGGERVCAACLKTLPFLRTVCPLCGRRVGEEGVCLDCKERRLSVDRARSVFAHEGDAARLVVRFKRGEKYLVLALAGFLEGMRGEFEPFDAVTYVPMTERAERARGYNQSRLLAEELAKRWELETISPAVKQRETAAQKTLGRKEREENLKGCFHVADRKGVRDKRILIVDDTMTTGATASELASALKRAGAQRVDLLTVTSVPRKDPFGIPPKKKRGER